MEDDRYIFFRSDGSVGGVKKEELTYPCFLDGRPKNMDKSYGCKREI
jgi:hypothetical protein